MKYIWLLLTIAACAKPANMTFVMPVAVTSEEERKVLVAVPIAPVNIEILD
tara:strand:- start:512 stop:664 length:153 start_codon:yes stop_codon:yes gene_type:complete